MMWIPFLVIFFGLVTLCAIAWISLREMHIERAIKILTRHKYCVTIDGRHIFKTKYGQYIIYYFNRKGNMQDEEVFNNSELAIQRFVNQEISYGIEGSNNCRIEDTRKCRT